MMDGSVRMGEIAHGGRDVGQQIMKEGEKKKEGDKTRGWVEVVYITFTWVT